MSAVAPSGERPAGLSRDVPFSTADFDRIAALMHAEAGIAMSATSEPLVYSRLSKRLRELGLSSFSAYIDLVNKPAGRDERQYLIARLTTNTTRFFRESHHFDILRDEVLPPLIENARRGGRVRLWSAACSTGEEVYSMAFTLLDICPDAAAMDIKILATDINHDVLAKAADALYPGHIVDALPDNVGERHFEKESTRGGERRVSAAARNLITFGKLNLIGTWPVQGPFDVVFCRNVAIYFDPATQDRVWQGFTTVMQPGGYLFIGHSERLSAAVRGRFDTIGMTAFRMTGAVGSGAKT